MKDLLEYILQNIIDEKSITVEENDQDGFVTLKIIAPKESMGRIIGKGGKTVNAIKNILKIRAIKEGKKVDIQVVEQT